MQPWLRFKDRTMDHSKVGKTHTKMLKQYLVLATTITMVGVAYGNPVLENVSSGNVSVTQSPNTTIVNQTSQQAIINWNSFNIAAGEKTQFVQPNASSVALNRINPAQGASQIYGSLSSNGQIILINGAGIHFGPNAMVNVGGMIASTSDISNANFLAGKYIFDMPSTSGGSIINEGRLTAANYGLIALIGSNVQNTGVIQARLGNVILGSGNKFTLDFYGDQLINFVVDEAASQGGTIKNSGEILADGGSILVTARTAQGVLDDAIDMGGVVQARSVSEKGGVIILSADEGAVNVTGKVIASGKKNGGTIKVLGQEVHLSSSAVLNANGRLGGGEILVGGNAHGAGTEQNAMTTTVDTGALLSANALLQGNGGKVIVWSNNATNFHGSISATGGVLSGNGGFVETSGHYLDVSNAKVNLLAANGTTGNWLLDPADLTICASCTTTASTSGNTFDTNGSNSYLLVSDLTTALSSADITLQTSATDTGGNGDIFVNTAVNWSSANTLTLSAANRIFLNADITANNGGLVLSAANTAQSITSGSEAAPSSTGVIANIAVNKFNLAQGQWYQVSPTLPSFSVGSDFQINSASGAVQFLRAVGGTGDSSSPYQLTDIYGVQGINSSAAMLSANYQLANNIDASGTAGWNNGTGFSPIGNDTTDFSGNFDGQNHTVNNYVSTRNGLFGVTDASATILNVGVTNATLTLSHMSFGNFGLLVGENNGAVNNAYSTGSISNQDSGGGEILGGLVGQNNGSIDTSYSTSTLTNNDTGGYEIVGGLVGLNNNIISGTHSTSIITNNESSGSELLGGLVGQNFGLIDTSYSTGSITNNDTHGSEVFGGLVGQNFYSISMAHSIENVSNNENGTGSENFGGLVGQNYGSIDTVYSNGVITNTDVNGAEAFSILVAYNVGSISNAYSSGRVVNNDSNDGGESFAGLVGLNFGSINSAFNTGTVFNNDVNGHEDFGGLVGVNGGDITDTYNLGNVTNTDTANGQENFAGLVGNNLGGTINNAYDAGTISNNNSMGSELFGPLVGNNSGQVNNAFWDMDTSGANTSTVGTGAHTATLMQQTTFCPSGNCSGNTNYFDFVNIWGVIPGDGINADGSYPYLLSFFTPAPRIISGFIPGGGPTATGLAGNTVELAVGGNNIDSVTTGYNGFYYFLEKSGTVADNTPFITYLSGAANKSNVVSNAPTHGASLALLNMTNNFIQVGGGVENSAGVLTIDPTLSISNSDLGLAATGLSSNDILYSVLGNNLTLSNSSHVNTTLQTDMLGYANTTYNINGTIASNSTETDTLNFYGLVSINTNSVSTSGDQTYHSTITANTDTTINSQNSSLNFADINGQSTAMSLLASNGSITLNGDISTLSNAQNALVLVDGISFINNAGSNALSASNSRYLIYSVNPNTDTLGGLMPTGKRYNTSYANNMPSSLSNQTGNLTLYTFAPVLTITADNVSSVYGADPALTYSVTGFINGDSATGLSGSAILTLPANVADLHVIGSPYTITASDGTLVSNENYGLTFVNGQLTVTPAALTVSAMGQNKVYDATTTANVALTNNGIASDNVSVNYNSADFSDKNAGTNKNISVSGISISGVNSADYILQNTTASTTADITPFALTIGATAQNKVYDSTTQAAVSVSSNSFSGDNINLNYGSAAFNDANAGTAKVVSVNGITLGGSDANNYTVNASTVLTIANITPAALTITANNQSKIYGQTPDLGTSAFTSSGLQGSDNVNSVNLTSSGTNANAQVANGPYAIAASSATGSNFMSSNYNITYADGSLTVTPAALTITANNASKTYGQTASFTGSEFTQSGLQNNESIGGVTLNSAGTSNTANVSGNNPYSITASSATGGSFNATNYTISYVNGGLTVNPATLTYTANASTTTYGTPATSLVGNVTGFVNNETLTTATSGTLGFASSATTNSNVGNYAITGSGLTANNGNYVFTQAVGNASALTINPATLTYAANTNSVTYGSTLPSLSGTVTGFMNGETEATATTGTSAFSSSVTTNSNVGTYAVNGAGLTANNGNYVFTQAAGNATALTINPATLVYTANAGTVTYGSSLLSLSGNVTGFVNGQTLATATTGTTAFSSTATSDSNVGTYAVNGSGLTANNGNYIFTQAASNAAALTINPATLTYTANTGTVTYGSSLIFLSGTVSGFVNGQTQATATTGTTVFSSAATSDSNVGTYAVNGSGLMANNGNYVFTQAASNATALTINPATLTYTANTGTVTYGSDIPSISGAVTGFVNGQTLATATTGNTAFTSSITANSNVGVYAVNGSGLTANNGNYVFTQAASNATALTINPATLTYTANTGTITYGSSLPSLSGAVTGFVNGQTLASATTGTSTFTSPANANSNVGNYAVNGSGLSANNGNYIFTQAASNAAALKITPATLTYAANTNSMTYGSAVPALSGNVTGFVNGQTLATATTGTAAYASPATSSSNVGNYAINGSGLTANNGNYLFVQAAGNATALSILQAQLTIAANNQSKVYGAALPTLTASYTGFVNGDTSANLTTEATLSTTATASSSVASSPYAITASGASAMNYKINYTSGNLTITPASLSVIANNQNINYGQTYSTTAVTYNGFVNGDTVKNLNTTATVSGIPSSDGQFHATNPATSTSTASASPFAPYTLTPSNVSNPNYTVSYVTGNLYVSPVGINFNVPAGSHTVAVNMSAGAPVTISGHSNLSTEQLQFNVDGTTASTSSFLVTDISGATITSHATNTALGTLVGLQVNATDTVAHTLSLSQNVSTINADTTNVVTPDSTFVPVVFGDPTTTLSLLGNGKNNTININSLDSKYTGTLTANTNGGTSDVINLNGLNAATPNTISLIGSTIDLNGDINLPNSTLNLTAASAAVNASSITSSGSSTGVLANINVNNFDLIQGGWYQDNSSLPTFNVVNNFQLNNIPNSTVQFIRAQSGNGSSTSPYSLTDVYGVEGMGSNTRTLGYNYQLANNIDATTSSHWNSGIGFIAVGNNTNNFTGSLNGQNFSISNLTVNNTTGTAVNNPAGLFGVTNNSTISNISVSGTFSGQTNVGGLIGKATNTTVLNANVLTGSVITLKNNGSVGGLIGLNVGGQLTNINSNAAVLGMSGNSSIGGLIGYNNGGTINYATSNGSVSASNNTTNNNIAGLIGVNTGVVNNSNSAGILNAANFSSNNNIAGFISNNSGAISSSSNNSTVTAGNNSNDADLAGFVAVNTGTIDTSSNIGTVTAGTNSSQANIAGFVADNYGAISNSSNQGAVTLGNNSSYGYIAGFVAENDIVINGNTVSSLGTITNSYNAGSVSGGNYTNHSSISGLVAMNYGNISNSSNQGALISGNNNTTQASDIAGLVADNTASSVNGSLVGGNITNSYNSGAVAGDNYSTQGNMGGLVAVNTGGTITGSNNSGAISGGNNSTYGDMAGLVADNNMVNLTTSSGSGNSCGYSNSSNTTLAGGTITGSSNTGIVTGGALSNQANIAGLVAVNTGTISNSFNTAKVTGGNGAASGSTTTYVTNNNIAGLVATNNGGTITNSYNSGAITGGNYSTSGDIAGLVADNYAVSTTNNNSNNSCGYSNSSNTTLTGGNITGSYNTGTVTGGTLSNQGNIAGLVAVNTGAITNSYNTAAVTGGNGVVVGTTTTYATNNNLAGLVGSNNGGSVTNSYNSGAISGGNYSTSGDIAGLVADNNVTSTSGGGDHDGGDHSGDHGGDDEGRCGYSNSYNTTFAGGTISGSYNTGTVNGGNFSSQGNIAGLVAINNGSIATSYNSAAITGGNGAINGATITYATNGNIAGLVALNNGDISGSYNTTAGLVTGGNYASHGDLAGLVAENDSTLSSSYNLGTVTGGNYSSHGNLGGLVATNGSGGSITSSYNSAVVTGGGNSTQNNLGGLVGNNAGTITSSTNNGNVTGGNNSQQMYIGGLAGYNSGTISKSYNYGTIQAGNYVSQLDIGGLVGFNSGYISNATNYGKVINGHSNSNVYISGTVGVNQGQLISVTNTGTVTK